MTAAPSLLPADEAELAGIVGNAAAARTPLAIAGGNTRARLGRPVQAAADLSTGRLRGVTLYEPHELVLSARAGTPLAEVEELLAQNRQRLAFEPMDQRPLYGSAGEPTIGAVAAANISGPRRISAGAARDALIGVRAVNGNGEVIRAGGRVMKNVTGYDLVKFLAGSYGTLAVLSEATFKVLPVPETESTLVLESLADGAAIAALSQALGSPFEVSGAAHIAADGGPARTLIRLEGFGAAIADRRLRLRAELSDFGDVGIVEGEASQSLWREVRDLNALSAPAGVPVWRLELKASAAAAVVDTIRRSIACRALYDWGGGLVWLAGGEGADAGAAVIRGAVAGSGGQATLVRAPDGIDAGLEIFPPLPAPLAELTRRAKAAFDPAGILNPGRMYAGV